jgi:molecular chaperone HtpG
MSNPEKFEFKAEIKKLLQILSKSLYQHKEIFLRELISNSSDALKKLHYISLQSQDYEMPELPFKIEIFYNPNKKTITISDTGLGMSKEELMNNLGTIASSGSQKFLEQLRQTENNKDQKDGEKKSSIDLDIIGQFGVGFYSVFMVAERAKVLSKSYLKDQPAYQWESDGSGEYTLTPCDKKVRGTDIVLYLQDDEKEYLASQRLESIIKKYSNFIPFPIIVKELKDDDGEIGDITQPVMEEVVKHEHDEEEELEEEEGGVSKEEKKEKKDKKKKEEKKEFVEKKPVNEIEPLWKRKVSDIKPEDYKSFYHFISRRYDDYAHVINYGVDGQVQFKSILYIPESKSADFARPDVEYGPDLYSKNVLITQNCKELIPQWMRFVKGVVDSEDIPLNISRETIQTNRLIMKMESLLVKKILNELTEMVEKDSEKYNKIWKQFDSFIKEGLVTDMGRKDIIVKLIKFKTTKTKDHELIGFDDYIKRMPADQEEIYYLVGENSNAMRLSPHLGYYNKKGYEVILLNDVIDNFLMMNLNEYKTTAVKGINLKQGEKQEKKAEEKKDETTEEKKEEKKEPEEFIYHFKSIDEAAKTEKDKEKEEKDKGEEKKDEIETKPEVKKFLEHVKGLLGGKVMDVAVSNMLFDNACRLATPSGGMTSTMQRAMRYWTQAESKKDFQAPLKILELNPEHPIIKGLIDLYLDNPNSGKIKPVMLQMYENCLLAEGDLPNPSLMVSRINQLLEMLITGKDDIKNPTDDLKEEKEESEEFNEEINEEGIDSDSSDNKTE